MKRFSERFATAGAVAAMILSITSTASAIVVDYTTVADGNYLSLALGGTTVTGSAAVTSRSLAGFRGLGILGTGSLGNGGDSSLDTGESMAFDLGQLASNVALTLVDIDPPGNVTFSFQAFNGASSLGTFSFPPANATPETYNLSTLAGGQSMSRFVVSVGSPSAPLGLQLQRVSFDAATATVPDGGSTLLLLGVAILGMGSLKRRFGRV